MKNYKKNYNISRKVPIYIVFWVIIASLFMDGLKTGFINFCKESYFSGSVSIVIGLSGIGVGVWRVLRHTYQWDLERGRVKRNIKLLR